MSILLDALKKSQKDVADEKQASETAQKPVPPPQVPSAVIPKPAAATRKPAPVLARKFSATRIGSIAAVAAILLYLLVISLSGGTMKSTPVTAPSTVSFNGKNVSLREPPSVILDPASGVHDSTSLRNLPKVEGIIWDSESPVALVGGKPHKIGDTTNGWLIQAITVDNVILSRDGATEVVPLPAPKNNR